MLVVVVICAVISLSAAACYLTRPLGIPPSGGDWRDLLTLILSLQIVAILIGGGIYCLQSIHREKDLNTFDYQRVTRLSPFELVIGKLFGAPVQMYFSSLCLMPVAMWAAFRAGVSVSSFLEIYLLIVLGSITYHALALLLSLVMERGTSAGGIVLFLIIVGLTSIDFSTGNSPLGIHTVSPFSVYKLIYLEPANGVERLVNPSVLGLSNDTFFGIQASHFWVLVALYVTLTAWFILAGVRNIKRDPVAYELYSPAQGFAFSAYLNLLLLGFFRWSIPRFNFAPPGGVRVTYDPIDPGVAELTFLIASLFFFALFGLTLLRNRDHVRRRIRELGRKAAGWWAAIWPAPYLLTGSLLAGLAIVLMVQTRLHPQTGWDVRMSFLEAAFFSVWVARDVLYLQWMNLRRVRKPIMIAVLYMVVFYTCASALFVPLGWYRPAGAAYASIFVPLYAFQIGSTGWGPWIFALGSLLLEGLIFAWLQWRALQRLLKLAVET
jgi:hypothetical protein